MSENLVIEQNSKEVIEQYFNDENVKKNLNDAAIHLNEISKGKWVGINFLAKKSVYKLEELKLFLDFLVMSKRAVSRKNGDIIEYKFVLDKESRKKALIILIEEYKRSIESLEKELSELN